MEERKLERKMIFWVVWLEEKIGEIFVGSRYFLSASTKMQSLQFREKC